MEICTFGDILYHGIGGLYKSKLDGSDEICLDSEVVMRHLYMCLMMQFIIWTAYNGW